MPDERYAAYRSRVDWMQTYVFPGSCIPSLGAIRGALASTSLALIADHDIGPDYAPTLRAWRERFLAALPEVRAQGFDEPFVRTWLLYLAFSEAAFAERTLSDRQLVLALC
jgi:cyclopropane-fatty-acyl-phospholipid synthase